MTRSITVLDGGTGRELHRVGAPFRQPEWSALALIEAPDAVRQVHAAYLAAGADVITSNSYALTPFHIGAARFATDGGRLADLAGRIGRAAIGDGPGRLAGSLPPVLGSYRPDLFDPAKAARRRGTCRRGQLAAPPPRRLAFLSPRLSGRLSLAAPPTRRVSAASRVCRLSPALRLGFRPRRLSVACRLPSV